MNILYCIPKLFNAAGMERVLTQKTNWLVNHTDWEVTIVTTEVVPEGRSCCFFPIDPRINILELNIHFDADYQSPILKKTIQHSRKQRQYKRQLTDIILQHHIDICVSLCGKEIEWLGKTSLPCKKIAEIHFAIDFRKQWILQKHSSALWKCIGRFLTCMLIHDVTRMDQLVVLTKADQKNWQQAGVQHVQCIMNPCSVSPETMGLHNQKQVLAVGRLEPQKGFDMLLEAWHSIVSAFPDWQLRICGEGSMRKALEEQIKRLNLANTVKMEGLEQDLAKEYQQSSIFVLSSRYEGLPLALMEAMACGTCCVAFDCPQGPAELLTHEENGILVPAESVELLAQAMARMMSDADGRSCIGQAAYRYAKKHFMEDPIMEQWVRLFENVE